MYVTDIIMPLTEERMQYARQLGVTHIVTRAHAIGFMKAMMIAAGAL